MAEGPVPDDLEVFSLQCLKIGCLRGFKYFRCHLRGREELLVTVVDADSRAQGLDPARLPRKVLPVVTGGHPPASPCDADSPANQSADPFELTFLIATYARYGRPMVWLRRPLVGAVAFQREAVPGWQSEGAPPPEHDAELPLRLFTIETWPRDPKNVHIWDVIAELVSVALRQAPKNPFALDWEDGILASLPRLIAGEQPPGGTTQIEMVQQLFASAALMSQLQIMAATVEMQDELARLCETHFEVLRLYFEQQQQARLLKDGEPMTPHTPYTR
eukprot:EG_transcript_16425